MNTKITEQALSRLPQKLIFPYFPDRHFLLALADFVGEGKTVRELKKSRFQNWLHKPLLNQLLANHNLLTRDLLLQTAHWQKGTQVFKLTFEKWGDEENWMMDWHQTSRRGSNLVIQLNFPSQHNHVYRKAVDPAGYEPFNYSGHPVSRQEHTLAWSRVDLDFETGEALIEEVQSDWIRLAEEEYDWQKGVRQNSGEAPYGREEFLKLRRYYLHHLAPFLKMWEEAILAATLEVLRNQLGMKTIYYHTAAHGWKIKSITGRRPPARLYRNLPKKMGFRKAKSAPDFLLRDVRENKTWRRSNRLKRWEKKLFERESAHRAQIAQNQFSFWVWEAPVSDMSSSKKRTET